MAKRALKDKVSFTLNGIRYTDIPYSSWGSDNNTIHYIGKAGTAKMIRQYLSQKYPKYKTWVQSGTGSSQAIDVFLNRIPSNIYGTISKDLDKMFEEGYFDGMTDSYIYTKNVEISDDGKSIRYGANYVFTKNQPPYGTPEYNQPAPTYDEVEAPTPSVPQVPSTPTSTKPYYGRGAFNPSNSKLVKECPAGWNLYEVLVNIKGVDKTIFKLAKGKETPPNKEQWDEIRGAMLSFGFKWNKFNQTFDKFNTIDDISLDALCATLLKYYEGKPTEVVTIPEPQGDRIFYEVKRFENKKDAAWFVYKLVINSDSNSFYYLWNDLTKSFDIRFVPNWDDLPFWVNRIAVSQEEANELVNGDAFSILTKYVPSDQLDRWETFVSIRPFNPKKTKNIRLAYCRIRNAEGFVEYAEKYPRTFNTFVEATTFIRENIEEVTNQGYDKHNVVFCWDDGSWGDVRWDVSQNEANPNEYNNLWAYSNFGGRFYQALSETAFGTASLQEWDDFYEARGLVGLEIDKNEFEKLFNNWTNNKYWQEKFKLNQEQLKDKIRNSFPKLFAMVEQSDYQLESDVEFIRKKIRGLELILGNEDVVGDVAEEIKKKIRGLKLIS